MAATPSEIKSCNCSNSFQDAQYGAGRRVFNPMKKEGGFRCSSCGSTVSVGSLSKKK